MNIPKKNRFKQVALQIGSLNRFFFGITFGVLLALVVCSVVFIRTYHPFPIKKVEIEGASLHISDDALYETMAPELKKGFFGLSVAKLRDNLCYMPWVEEAGVKRVWPDSLVINIQEYKPMVVWNDHTAITAAGHFIKLDNAKILSSLPHFYGPEGKYEQIFAQWRKMGETLSKIDLKIVGMELAPRGAWQLTLSNGVIVRLGTQDVQSRLDRFVRAYSKVLQMNASTIDYVDMRYTIGMAVGLKNESF